jgi:hypothetical protein
MLQGRKMKLPVYRVVGTLGAAHKQTFDVECEVPELGLVERGIGASRRAGEQAAAAAMLATVEGQALMTEGLHESDENNTDALPEERLRPKIWRAEHALRAVKRPPRRAHRSAAAWSPSSASPTSASRRCLNALVGQKISITSRKAQTTRHRITGIKTRGATQFVFVDTPGFQTHHNTALNRSLNKTVLGAVGDVDLSCSWWRPATSRWPTPRCCRSQARHPVPS